MKKLTLLFLTLVFGTTLWLNSQESTTTHQKEEYPLMMEPDLKTFSGLVETAKLADFFQGTGPFTVFAPSNEAFSKFDQTTLENLKKPENRDRLIDLINYHVILGKYLSKNMKSGSFRTVNGKDITIRKDDNGQIWVNEAKVVRVDLVGPNGVAHVIDMVLVP